MLHGDGRIVKQSLSFLSTFVLQGLSELAQLAAEKVDITMLIVHSSTGFTLTHRSALGEKVRLCDPHTLPIPGTKEWR